MNLEMIARIEGSFNMLSARAQELVDRFYALLFARNPTLRPMFPVEMAEQKDKLLASLVLVIKNLRTPEKLLAPLQEMGSRHAAVGARPEHYSVVRDTLVEVMAEMAGRAWSEQLTRDWQSAIDVVATIMLQGYPATAASHTAS